MTRQSEASGGGGVEGGDDIGEFLLTVRGRVIERVHFYMPA